MLKKVTVFVATCVFGLFFMGIDAKAQEEGGTEEREDVIAVSPDTSNIEVTPHENKPEIIDGNMKVPSDELPATRPILNNRSIQKPETVIKDGSDKQKIKESKPDISFNILYYLIYRFKQVDVKGE